jgi:AcrR family transcriptional regulator
MPEKLPVTEKTEESARDKRKAIITAAREIFSRRGYEATTIAEIASAAEVAVGTVYLYFHNKREIYVALSLNWSDEIAEALIKPEILEQPIEKVPRAIIEISFQFCHTNNKFMPLFQVDLQTPQEIELHHKSDQQLIQAISGFLLLCVARGDFLPFDTETYAKILFNLVHSVLYDCFCIEGGNNEERYRENTIEIVERIFFGPSMRG